jgi:Mrp family chromosome partitioning ATPase
MSNTQRRGSVKPPSSDGGNASTLPSPGNAQGGASHTGSTAPPGATSLPAAPATTAATATAPVATPAQAPLAVEAKGEISVPSEGLDARMSREMSRTTLHDEDPTRLLGGLLDRGGQGAAAAAAARGSRMSGWPTARHMAAQTTVEMPPQTEKPKVWIATHKPAQEPDPRLILLRDPDSEQAASFRILRHRLAERGDPRIIAVSSPSAREGKTICAVNLAMALSECGRAKVLLIEANLRTPALAAVFGFLPPECFSAQLVRHRDRPLDPWSIVEAFSPFLHVAAVKPGDEPRPLLDGPSFALAIDVLARAGYDYMVIDTSPVLGSADVNLIEDSCDGVLLTAWSRSTNGRALRRSVEQLSPTKILGIMLLDA